MQSISDYIVELNPACFERHEFQMSQNSGVALREREKLKKIPITVYFSLYIPLFRK